MAVAKLDKNLVESLGIRVSEKTGRPVNYTVWDTEDPGFGIQVTRYGVMSWVLKYVWGRRQEWYVFGAVAPKSAAKSTGMTVSAARTAARAMKDGLKARPPINPKAARDSLRKARTVKELAEKALKEHWTPNNREKSVDEIKAMLNAYVIPKLGKELVRDITDAHITRLHQEIAGTKKLIRGVMKPMTTRANRVLACLSKMFSLAEKWGDRPKNTNPCQGQERKPEIQRKRYLKASEMPILANALAAVEPRYPMGVVALRLLLATGARKSEILNLEWSWVDLDAREIHLPACLLYTSPSPRDGLLSRMPSSA